MTKEASMRIRSIAVHFVLPVVLSGGVFAQVAAAGSAVTPVELRAAAQPSTDQTWWKHAVIYEIYPRSFQDSNGDGIGDLNGITQRLDYLQKLGVDAVWISPMYPSPQVDFGYDISNYENVDPQYGTLADFDRLVAEAKQRKIRVILDMVLNHTSDKHRWFEESKTSRENAKADWYCWADGVPVTAAGVTAYQKRFVVESKKGRVVPPNNWESLFGGSAWEWVPARQQFYYHKFYKQQPDLNWRNPAVEKAMFDAMRFWLDRGVAGFRLDAIPTLFEDQQLRNEPVSEPGVNAQGDPYLNDIYTNMLPEVHAVLRRMRAMVDGYAGDRVLIGETYLPDTAALSPWYGSAAGAELQLPMDMLVGFHAEGGGPNGENAALNAAHFRESILEAETELHGSQPLLVFDNHDNTRSWDRFGDGVHNEQIAKIIATLLLTSRATALMYYGEEIGMPTTVPARVEDVKDPIGITGWPREKGRDGERTPMQWDNSNPQAGFSTDAKTWLPVPANYVTLNVKTEESDRGSLLSWYRDLIRLRGDLPALHDGGVVMLDAANAKVLSYVRTAPEGAKAVVVALNMSGEAQTVSLDLGAAGVKGTHARTVVSDGMVGGSVVDLKSVTLPAFGSWVGIVE